MPALQRFLPKYRSEDLHRVVLKILDASKKTLEKFNDKFDWSKRATTSGYGDEKKPEADQKVLSLDGDTTPVDETPEQNTGATEETKAKTFSFDDVNFDN